MKPSETVPIFNLVAQKFKETGERLTHQELQQLLLERGLSAGNFYQEIEMDSAYVDAHEDISTSYNKIVVFIDRSPAECYNKFRMLWIGGTSPTAKTVFGRLQPQLLC